ncbi:MAG: DNA mismatch repair protein MutS [Candidatus Hodarchaeales archaeon]
MPSKSNPKTRAMIQYEDIKKNYPDTIVFFQLGDFYEVFYEDAKVVSKKLNITLTSKGFDPDGIRIPLAGVPVKSIDTYLKKLINLGHKVAIVDQLEDAKNLPSGRIVKRGVTRVVTPGTVFETSILDDTSNNFLLSFVINEKRKIIGFSLVDISTGEFLVSEFNENCLKRFKDEFTRFKPKEVIFPDTKSKGSIHASIEEYIRKSSQSMINPVNETLYNTDTAKQRLMNHFKVKSLSGFGCESMNEGIRAAGAVISHLSLLKAEFPKNLMNLKLLDDQEYLVLDSNTQRNLEIIGNAFDGRVEGSLLSIFSDINTNMGARLLRRWLLQPLRDITVINARLDSVGSLFNSSDGLDHISNLLSSLSDFQRLISKIKYNSVNARDLISLKNSLKVSIEIRRYIIGQQFQSEIFMKLSSFDISDLVEIEELISRSIQESPPVKITEGGIINPDINLQLKDYYQLKTNQKAILKEIESDEQNRTSFNIKLGYNSVHGYYFEVTKAQLRDAGEEAVPDDYTRRQTLVNAERFITPRLKNIEEKILNLDEKLMELEHSIFCDICNKISKKLSSVAKFSEILAELDILACYASIALKNSYCKPDICEDSYILIEEGRHAVVEQIQSDTGFIHNTVSLKDGELHIITGPNMSGKSTLIRQVALIILMAQTGSWVPAKVCKFGIVDKIFTRVGAFDRLTFGQSTFMVEMLETAHILNNATSRSLIILDEVGRGTSTYDGLSLAWAIAEHIVSNIECRTLFATHYHQLSELDESYQRVKNFHLTAKERNGKLMLLYKLHEGATDHSFGISVAKMAGVPQSVILEAQKKLLYLESISDGIPKVQIKNHKKGQPRQLSLAEALSKSINHQNYNAELKDLKLTILAFLKNYSGIDINFKTPIEALQQLGDLVEAMKELESKIQE